MVNTPNTHHRKHVSKARAYKHAIHVSTQARKHAKHVYTPSTWARKQAKHATPSTRARQARDLADSTIPTRKKEMIMV